MEYINNLLINNDFLELSSMKDNDLLLVLKKEKDIDILTVPSVSFTSNELIKTDYSSFFNINTNGLVELFIISKIINKEQIDTIKGLCQKYFHYYKLSTFEYDEILDNNIYVNYHKNTIMIYGKKDDKDITFYKLNDRWFELDNS